MTMNYHRKFIINLKNCQGQRSRETRVRIAPSPTGPLHIGTARTALFNYLFAKKYGGKFILRIEDTDLERSDKKWEKDILEGLEWLGLKYDEGPYRQSERLDIYEKYIRRLLEEEKAFWCYHSEQELAEEKERQIRKKESPRHMCEYKSQNTPVPFAFGEATGQANSKFQIPNSNKGIIRLDTPKKNVKFNDLIRGEIEFDTALLGDISLAKDERTPLYNFAVVIDDYEMKISHVIRGEDHISNTPKQILIQEALGFLRPQYAHLPLILGPDRSKLSKRHGAVSVNEYRSQGYLASAMLNFIALLGWNPGDKQEIFSLQELIKKFSLEKIQKGGAIFNVDKLDWLNGYYIRKKPVKELTKLILKEKFLQAPSSKLQSPSNYIENIIALEQPRLKKLSEIREKTDYFFEEPKYDKELLKWKNMNNKKIKNSLEKSKEIIKRLPTTDYRLPTIEKIFLQEAAKFTPLETHFDNFHQKRILKKQSDGKFLTGFQDRGELFWPLRVALSGKKASPGPFEIAAILGKKETLKRLSNALNILNGQVYEI